MFKRLAFTSWAAGVGIAIAWAGSFGAAEFPAKSTYLFFVQGKSAGKSEIACTEESGAYVFNSTSEVAFSEYTHTLTCRTEFDKKTLRARLFRYKGVRMGESLSGTVRIEGGLANGDLEAGGTSFSARAQWVDPTFLFQNYVPEHLAILARHLAASDQPYTRFTMVFPSDMMSLSGIATVESEVELATRPSPAVCKKYVVTFQNSAPFALYIDRKRNLPIYMDFPAVQAEVFLQSAYGDHPATRYVAPVAPAAPR
jgi:hypothetical protein